MGAFQIATKEGSGRVLQMAGQSPCCNFIPQLDSTYPITVLVSSTWSNLSIAVDVILPLHGAPSYRLIGLRASFNGASFFQGGLGFPKGLYMVVESDDSWRVITAVASLGATLPLPACDAAKN